SWGTWGWRVGAVAVHWAKEREGGGLGGERRARPRSARRAPAHAPLPRWQTLRAEAATPRHTLSSASWRARSGSDVPLIRRMVRVAPIGPHKPARDRSRDRTADRPRRTRGARPEDQHGKGGQPGRRPPQRNGPSRNE